VEHDPEAIWQSVRQTANAAIDQAGLKPADIAGIGITNQRETTLIWDRRSGEPIYNAIVWQDRRTSDYCRQLIEGGHEEALREKTGLLIDPYFSATKIRWLLDNVSGARERARRGELAFGTVDSFLLWRLTGGKVHRTDASNASRTLLFNIHSQQWDEELLDLFDIPASLLPEVCDCAADFGQSEKNVFGGEIPILAMLGDQQSALVGQACFREGMAKSTYGTGCFFVLNTGTRPLQSEHKLLTTVGYRLQGQVTYALEGSIFVAGAAIQWLRDGLRFIQSAGESEALARQTPSITASFWCRPSPASGHPTGTRKRAAPSSASPATRASGKSSPPVCRRSAIKPWTCKRPWKGTACRPPCCGWTAAWPPMTG